MEPSSALPGAPVWGGPAAVEEEGSERVGCGEGRYKQIPNIYFALSSCPCGEARSAFYLSQVSGKAPLIAGGRCPRSHGREGARGLMSSASR